MANYEEEVEYLIPAPVLTSTDKIFNFGFIAFSMPQMIEMGLVAGLVYLLWQVLAFLPWQALGVVSIFIVVIGYIFITQPINGLPGDAWLLYALRYYVLERSRRLLVRRGQNPVRLTGLRLLAPDGRVAMAMGEAFSAKESPADE